MVRCEEQREPAAHAEPDHAHRAGATCIVHEPPADVLHVVEQPSPPRAQVPEGSP